MPYQKYGQLPNPQVIPRPYQSILDELIFEDGATAHSSGFQPGTQGWIIRSDGTVEFQGEAVFGGAVYFGSKTGPYILIDLNSFINEIHFSHALEDAPFDLDNVGYLRTYSGVSGAGLEIVPPYDNDTKVGHFQMLHGGQGVLVEEVGDTSDTHLSQLVKLTASETDTVVLQVENSTAATADLLRVRHNGRKVFAVREYGVYTDYSHNDLPRTFYRDLGSRTNTGTAAWEEVATIFDEDLGTDPISITATATAFFEQTASALTRDGRMRVQISTDGGSTFPNTSPPSRGDGLTSSGIARMPTARVFGVENVTPTGNVQVRVQFWAGTSTDITLQDIGLKVDVNGDS